MQPDLELLLMGVALLVMAIGARTAGYLSTQRGQQDLEERALRLRKVLHLQRPEAPATRPIEQVAVDVRRLGARFHGLPPTTPFVKFEGVRAAYDRVLTECCACLGCTHLLEVIAPGPELDDERRRVERVLAAWGLPLSDAA